MKILIVRTETELAEMLSQLEKADTYCLDTETLDRGLFDLSLVGLSLSFDGKRGFYVPTGHAEESAQLPAELVLERMKPILERPGKMCLMHNAKYDLEVLKVLGGIDFPQDAGLFCSKEKKSPIYDTMVAAWLLDTENEIGLKALSKRYLKHTMVELSEIAKKEKHPVTGDDVYRPDLVPIDELAKYAIDDAVRPFQLKQIFDQGLEKWGLEKVFYELEMPYVFVLTDMELAGVLINREKLEEFYGEAPDKLKALEQRIFACRPGGEEFNIGSQPQLNQVLFKELGIKPLGEKGKSGYYSTKEEYMEVWANKHEICKLILDYRKLDKLIGTYLTGLSKRIDPDGRIRSNFKRFISTGRLSSSRPNCYDDKTEVLTDCGWKKFSALEDERVAQWCQDGTIEFVTPEQKIKYLYSGDMIRIVAGGIDLLVTPDHRMLTKTRRGNLVWEEAREWSLRGGKNVDRKSVRGGVKKDGRRLSEEERLDLERAVAIQADGHVRKDWNVVELSFKSERKQAQAERLWRMKARGNDGRTVVYVPLTDHCFEWLEVDRVTGRKVFKASKVLGLCVDELQEFLNMIWRWDGDSTRKATFLQHRKHEDVVDLVQAVALLCGFSTSRYDKDERYTVVNVHKKSERYLSKTMVSSEYFAGEVYCVTVPSGAVVVRRNGCVVVSGNCQNIPRPENDLFGLRSLFIAPEGKTLIVADYSQIELRILAHFSRDPKLIEAYMNGEDIHAATAKALFDLPEPVSEVKEKHGELRSIAKNYNFAMVYEAGVKKLAAMTGTTESRAKQLREKYFDRFPGIERYQQWMHHRAERDGYVKTLVGRYRHLSAAQLPGKTKKENALKYGAFRQSSNTPIQGSAADVISIAMRNINRRLKDEGYSRDEAQIVLQVHDELILEVVEEAAPEVAKLVASEMENAVKLRVPIVADVGIAPIWSEAK